MCDATTTVLKSLNIDNMLYEQKRHLIQAIVDRVVYSRDKLIITINTTPENLRQFTDNAYINQKSDPMDFTVSANHIVITVPIILRKYVNTVFDKSKNGVLTVTDNNHLILKVFATAWKYRDMYEECGEVAAVAQTAKATPRTIYKYLDLAYMNPKIVNNLLSESNSRTLKDIISNAKLHSF